MQYSALEQTEVGDEAAETTSAATTRDSRKREQTGNSEWPASGQTEGEEKATKRKRTTAEAQKEEKKHSEHIQHKQELASRKMESPVITCIRMLASLRGKAKSGTDMVTKTILQSLSFSQLERIAKIFEDAINSDDDMWNFPKAWMDQDAICIGKKDSTATDPKPWRSICCVSMLSKWFFACAVHMEEKEMFPMPDRCRGFRRGGTTSDMIGTIRLMLQKAYEWDISMAWGSLDVASAFERVQHDTLRRGYKFRKASREFIFVVERSLRSTIRIVAYGKAGERIILERGTRMGTMESPGYFTTALVYILAFLVEAWEKAGMLVQWKTGNRSEGEGCGFEGDPVTIAIMVWADNIYPIANSLENWSKMVADIQEALVKEGMEIKPKEHFVQTNDTERRHRRRAAAEAKEKEQAISPRSEDLLQARTQQGAGKGLHQDRARLSQREEQLRQSGPE